MRPFPDLRVVEYPCAHTPSREARWKVWLRNIIRPTCLPSDGDVDVDDDDDVEYAEDG